jgi:uncharacterized OB-fold protein
MTGYGIAPTIKQKIQIPYNYSAGPAMTKFLRGLQEKVIYASLCTKCGRRSVPPLSFCGRCWLPIDQYVPVEQQGVLESFVEGSRFPSELGIGSMPAAYGLIRLTDCNTNLVHLVQAAPGASLTIGAKARPVWRDERKASILDIAYFLAG